MESEVKMGGFLRAMNRFARVSVSPISSTELTKGEFFCLGAICSEGRERPERGGLFVWELARRTHARPPAVSRTLRDLEARGYIERSVDREDRRNIKVRPTEEGLAVWARAEKSAHRFVERVLGRMGEENMEELVALCNQLCDIIEDEQAKETNLC